MRRCTAFASILVVLEPLAAELRGQVVQEFDVEADWLGAVGEVTTVGLCCCGELVLITDQYADQGVIFPEGNDFVTFFSPVTFPNDGWGMDAADYTITLEFLQPQRWIAAAFPGAIAYELFLDGNLLYTSSWFLAHDPLGIDGFGGLVSLIPFDNVVITDPFGVPFLDDLYFGAPTSGDVNADGTVDVSDLVAVILSWGPCRALYCIGDANVDGTTDVADLALVIANWD